ncbi:thiosulfate oxidation carrier protein SoxY [Breoghania sp. L-A4]|uniref:thiosulfate oxidation carrier protein SoxY n=1 Tax=Breoghania sp. L-A4 TaxID=2304600 RepID=UPI000E3602E9|nr:thiosulfate oxidation carrier protein SoxY [Breoghania sp. L-A4]AXS40481.1 thiosulfate oxidation carrier protein SoxY [Breoghania sp. L-A4]
MTVSLNRRQALALGAGAAALFLTVGPRGEAFAASDDVKKAIMDFTGGKEPATGKVELTAPEIAENGNTVPMSVSVESPMTSDDYVASVLLLAAGNPNPGVATFHFSDMSGECAASTRMRLAKTQDVIAVAKMADGSVFIDTKTVKVTIGGCGG